MASTVLALGLLAACSGSRPELVAPLAEAETDTETAAQGTTVPAPERAECETAFGGGPWPVAIGQGASPAEVSNAPCVALAGHQRLELVNQSGGPVDVIIGSTGIPLQVGASQVTEPVGTFLTPGFNPVTAGADTATGLWLVDPAENSLAGSTIGLTTVGDIELGQSPVDITAASGGTPVAASGAACNETFLQGDPYSPLFTFRDGLLVVVQVFTPGLLTRSGVGVGAAEADVVAAYGEQVSSLPDPGGDPARTLLEYLPNDEADRIYRLVFVVDQGQVTAIRIGAAEIVAIEPGCPPT